MLHKRDAIDAPPNSETSPSIAFRLTRLEADIPAILKLAGEAHSESRFGHIPFSSAKVENIARTAFNDEKRRAVMLAEKGGHPVGFAYCSVGEYHIGDGVLITTIHNMNVSRSVRSTLSGGRAALGLFKGIETWSQARGSSEVLFHVTSGVDLARAHKLAKRIGFTFVGGSYAKKI